MFGKTLAFFKKWFWTEPTVIKPLKAKEVLDEYIVINYKDQYINLGKTEVKAFYAMSRIDKRGMANRFKALEKKKLIRFEKIDDKVICIKNKNYEHVSQQQ